LPNGREIAGIIEEMRLEICGKRVLLRSVYYFIKIAERRLACVGNSPKTVC
jgi:hypothetical protein